MLFTYNPVYLLVNKGEIVDPKNVEGWIYSHMVKKMLITYLKRINFLSELNKDEYSL